MDDYTVFEGLTNYQGSDASLWQSDAPAAPSIGIMPSEWNWQKVLTTVTSGVGAVAKTIGDLEIAKIKATTAREDQAFNSFMRSLSLDTQKSVATSASEIERIRAQTSLAKEQRKLQGAQGTGAFSLLSGDGGGSLMIMLTIAGLVFAWWSLKKR